MGVFFISPSLLLPAEQISSPETALLSIVVSSCKVLIGMFLFDYRIFNSLLASIFSSSSTSPSIKIVRTFRTFHLLILIVQHILVCILSHLKLVHVFQFPYPNDALFFRFSFLFTFHIFFNNFFFPPCLLLLLFWPLTVTWVIFFYFARLN